MDHAEPKVSVVIPVYNAASTLKRSVESVLTQTLGELEIILVDDGSTDRSAHICDLFALQDSRVVVLRQTNSGVSAARNAGIHVARGAFVTFVDADDCLHPRALDRMFSLAGEMSADIVACGQTIQYHRQESPTRTVKVSIERRLVLDSPDLLRRHFFELLENQYLISSCAKLFRVSFLQKAEVLFDPQLAILEDLNFVLECIRSSPVVVADPSSAYTYFVDESSELYSRRPRMNYVANFRTIAKSLKSTAALLDVTMDQEVRYVQKTVFSYYMVGIVLLFSHYTHPGVRYRVLNEYVNDEDFEEAARWYVAESAKLRIVSWCIRHKRTWALYALLWAREVRKRIERSQAGER